MKIVDIKEVAAFLKMKESTLYSWVGSGLIPSFKLNGLVRFDMEELRLWVSKNKKAALSPKRGPNKSISVKEIDRIIERTIESIN